MLFVGRLGPEKGLDLLLDAWADTKKTGQVSGWKLVVAGPDYRGYERTIRRRVAALGLDSDVAFTGFVQREERRALSAACDAFVLPSRSEALSISLLEAAASGRPALYTRTCNFPELARCGGGWEVQPSVEGLMRGLKEVTGQPREALLLAGEAGRRFVREHHHADEAAEALVRLYRDVSRGALSALGAQGDARE
jgi:glycosyltransferase involved in cell wall biosynthesis